MEPKYKNLLNNWFRHFMKLPNDIPVKIALEHYMKGTLKASDLFQETWVSIMKKDLQNIILM